MVWQYTPYSFILFLTAVGQVFLALFARRQSRSQVSTLFTGVTLCAVWWAVSYGLEIAGVGIETKLFWARASLTGAAALVTIWSLLVLAYAGPYRWISTRLWLIVAAVPAATIVLAWTNDSHHLIWRFSTLVGDDLFLSHRPGPWLWLFFASSYVYLSLSVLLLLRLMWRSISATFRWQAGAMLLAVLLPWSANFLVMLQPGPMLRLDLTPFALAFSSLALYQGLKRYFLLDVTPIARSDVINSLEEGVIVVDREGRILNANRSAEEILQKQAPLLIGQPIRASIRELHDWSLPADDQVPASIEFRLDLPGGPRHYRLRMVLFQDRDRAEHGYLLLLTDISSHKKVQKMRQDLTHAIVHDLRSPVSNLALALDWLERFMGKQLASEEKVLLQSAQQTAQKLLLMVSSILDLERLEAGEMPLRCVPLDVGVQIEQALQQQRLAAQVKHLTLISDVAPGLPAAFGDPELVERVLQNLVSNATKFTPEHGKIRLEARRVGESIRITVQDDGPGIEPDAAAHLFEKFKPGYESGHGSGVGLAFCKLAVEAHGEQIWVESPPQGGTRVSFTLRCAGDPLRPAAPIATAQSV